MRKTCFSLLVLSCLLSIAGCQSAANALPAAANRATPTGTPAPTRTPTPSPTPGPLPNCPQLPAAAPGQPPSAFLSLYGMAYDNDDLVALNASNGRQRWRAPVKFPGDYQVSVAVEQNVVYVVVMQMLGGYVEALNASDGKLRWCTPALSPSDEEAAPQLAIDAGVVYVGDGLYGFITAFHASDGSGSGRRGPKAASTR
jgi:PQQ-like domain